ncbi:MAG: hypothetical protein FD180_3454, partial [Planctomycetota bacterium]
MEQEDSRGNLPVNRKRSPLRGSRSSQLATRNSALLILASLFAGRLFSGLRLAPGRIALVAAG